jgi:hypothetical protein
MLASCEIGKKVKLLTPPRAGFLHYIFSRVDKDRADVFLDRLITGESLSESSPILLYRNKMISQQAHKRDRMGELAFGIISFNHFQSGKYPKDLRWADRSKFPRVLGEKIS